MNNQQLDNLCINAIRILSADAIEKAKSGHPGLPMGAAPTGYLLYDRIMRYNPANPYWYNRDRFILSAGHGSMLQYCLLYLCGYDSPKMEDIKNFRQWLSNTPGHPENITTPGVEVTTGPLGQGFANAVGLACAERHMASRFNKPGFEITDHYTYCIVGDGCLMEGISSEAASLAGHLGLGRLIVLYDDNKITIDGSTSITFTEDTSKKFEALGWQVLEIKDGDNDLAGIENALISAKECTNKPTLIRVHTTIGCGSPKKQATESCHGAPLGKEELEATRKNLGWTFPPFEMPEQVLNHTRKALDRGKKAEEKWDELLKAYSKKYPEEYATFTQQISDRLPQGWSDNLPLFSPTDKPAATRVHSGTCLNELARHFKGLFGGSADLSPSNVTLINGSGDFQKDAYHNQNIRFGVREHAMGAMCNGIALHGSGMIPYCASFLAFVDYMRNAIRMSALSQAGVIYIFTHDSVAVGEDGPTHQPVEHVASLRLIPNLTVIRPADGNETSGAYKVAVESRNRPTALIFTRQNVPHVEGTSAACVAKGGYILTDCPGKPDLILIATGSELHICVEAAKQLLSEGIKVRLVSLPCWNLFEEQSKEYQQSVLPDSVPLRLAVEAGSPFGWSTFIGPHGDSISIKDFGHSAPGDTCMKNRGYTVENVIYRAKKLLKID